MQFFHISLAPFFLEGRPARRGDWDLQEQRSSYVSSVSSSNNNVVVGLGIESFSSFRFLSSAFTFCFDCGWGDGDDDQDDEDSGDGDLKGEDSVCVRIVNGATEGDGADNDVANDDTPSTRTYDDTFGPLCVKPMGWDWLHTLSVSGVSLLQSSSTLFFYALLVPGIGRVCVCWFLLFLLADVHSLALLFGFRKIKRYKRPGQLY